MSAPALEVVRLEPFGHALRVGKLTLATFAKGTRARRAKDRWPRVHPEMLGLARSVEARLTEPGELRRLEGSEVVRLRRMLAGTGS